MSIGFHEASGVIHLPGDHSSASSNHASDRKDIQRSHSFGGMIATRTTGVWLNKTQWL